MEEFDFITYLQGEWLRSDPPNINVSTIVAMDGTLGQPQVKLNLLRSFSLKIRPRE